MGEADTTCPVCGAPAGQASHQLASDQEYCGTDDCPIITWDSALQAE